MPSTQRITGERMVSLGIRLLEALSSSPDQTLGAADAAAALDIDETQVPEVVRTLASLSDRLSGARAAISIEGGTVRLRGDAAQIMPRRLGIEGGMVLAHVLDLLNIDDETRERVRRAVMPLGQPDDAPNVAEPPRYGSCFSQLSEALSDGIRCRVAYRSLQDRDAAERLVDPIALSEEDGKMYLIAWDVDKDAERRYRLDRIRDVAFTEDSVETHDAPSMTTAESLRRSGTPVRISVPDEAYARNLNWAGIGHVVRTPQGRVELTVYCSSEAWLFDQVISAGSDMVIERPAVLRERLRDYAERLRCAPVQR